jgi:hypothetical protein
MAVIENGYTADKLATGVSDIVDAAHAAFTALAAVAGSDAAQAEVDAAYVAINAYVAPNLTAPTLTAA